MPQRGVNCSHVVQWTGRGPGSPPPPLGYSTSHPGLGAGLAGSEVKRYGLWLQGVQGLVARCPDAGKGYLPACPGPQVTRPGVRAPPGLRITQSPHAVCPGGSPLSELSSET